MSGDAVVETIDGEDHRSTLEVVPGNVLAQVRSVSLQIGGTGLHERRHGGHRDAPMLALDRVDDTDISLAHRTDDRAAVPADVVNDDDVAGCVDDVAESVRQVCRSSGEGEDDGCVESHPLEEREGLVCLADEEAHQPAAASGAGATRFASRVCMVDRKASVAAAPQFGSR